MAKRQRTLLFLILFGIFLLAAPSVVLYSQGYRIDWNNKRIAQTSAFFIKAIPARADVFIDEKPQKRTDFLFGTSLISNVFPGQYLLEVNKEGYHSWKKILEIQRAAVTEIKNIILFPKKVAFQRVQDRVQDIWHDPTASFLLFKKLNADNTWELVLLDLETLGEKQVLSQQHSKHDVVDITFSQNSSRYLVTQNVADKIQYSIHAKDSGPCEGKPCTLDFLTAATNEIVFSPANADHILYTVFSNSSQILLSANYKTSEIFKPISNNVAAFATRDNSVFWLDETGSLWEKNLTTDLAAQRKETSAFQIQREQPLELLAFPQAIFVKTQTGLTQLFSAQDSAQQTLSAASDVLLSPDGKKLALSTGSELWLLYLEEEKDQPNRKKGEQIFLTRLSSPIRNLSWLGSHHLLFSTDNMIRVMEIDTRDRLNSADLASFSKPQTLLWHEPKSILYVLNEGALMASERLLR